MIVYLKSHGRRPVCWGRFFFQRDKQAAIPAGWCVRCGREVFALGQELCSGCRERRNV